MSDVEPTGGPPRPTGLRKLDFTVNAIGALAAIAATVWGVVVKIQVDQQNLLIEKIKGEIGQSAELRENRKLDQEITLKVFDEVKDIYKTEKQSPEILVSRLSAVSALILAVPDQAIKERLGEAVGAALQQQTKSSNAEAAQQALSIKSSLDAGIFDASIVEQSTPAEVVSTKQIKNWAEQGSAGSPKWGALTYNLFWCENANSPNGAYQAAAQAQALKTLDPNARGEWRVRKLPRSVNERPGYQIHRNVIRTSSDEETAIAKTMIEVLAQHGSTGFTIEQINYPSPASISIFFCGGATP
jgi:hypothetical protein